MAITDALTGLHNRRYMESHLATLAEQAAARGKPLALMMLDIDYFKSINDSYGHDAGDDVLREFAVRVRKSIRGIDLACRYRRRGVRDRDARDRPACRRHGRRTPAPLDRGRAVRDQQGAPSASRSRSRSASPSLEKKGEAVGDVLKRADTALYRAKHDGRNRVVSQAA